MRPDDDELGRLACVHERVARVALEESLLDLQPRVVSERDCDRLGKDLTGGSTFGVELTGDVTGRNSEHAGISNRLRRHERPGVHRHQR